MQTIAAQLVQRFQEAIQLAFGVDVDPLIAVAQNAKFGDYQSNAAMGLSKQLQSEGRKSNPRAVAELIVANLQLESLASEVSIAGPGFINVRLSNTWLASQLGMAAADDRLGLEPTPYPLNVVVDYSGPNIAKQMHVGHLRSTIIGDAISRVLAFQGHRVIRQNHIGDWGTQFGRVVLALWYAAMAEHSSGAFLLEKYVNLLRLTTKEKDDAGSAQVVSDFAKLHRTYLQADATGGAVFEPYLQHVQLDLSTLEALYTFVSQLTEHPAASREAVGDRTLADLPRLITTFIQNPDEVKNRQERLAWEQARRITLATGQELYRRLGVQLAEESVQAEPVVRGESFYSDLLPGLVAELLEKKIATRSEGAVVVMVPGFEAPLLIQKSDGSYLYGTTDLAAVKFRIQRLHAQRIIYTHDSRQSQHFAQVFWAARQAGWATDVELDYAPFGTMLGVDNRPFKTRAGDTVKLKDLIDESEERALAVVTEKAPLLSEEQRRAIAHAVGIGAVKYSDLAKDRVSDYVFSWEKMLSFDGNTAPYLQNAFVRIHGIFRKAAARDIDASNSGRIAIEAPQEHSLALQILRAADVIDLVARELKPHHLCAYLYDLATTFHSFFEHCPVLQSADVVRDSRLALCALTARCLALGMDLLGIEHPEQM